MTENDMDISADVQRTDGTGVLPAKLPPTQPTMEPHPPDSPPSRRRKKSAKGCGKAVQEETYREQVATIVSRNTGLLSAYAEHATEAVPSAAPLLSRIVDAYSSVGDAGNGNMGW